VAHFEMSRGLPRQAVLPWLYRLRPRMPQMQECTPLERVDALVNRLSIVHLEELIASTHQHLNAYLGARLGALISAVLVLQSSSCEVA